MYLCLSSLYKGNSIISQNKLLVLYIVHSRVGECMWEGVGGVWGVGLCGGYKYGYGGVGGCLYVCIGWGG